MKTLNKAAAALVLALCSTGSISAGSPRNADQSTGAEPVGKENTAPWQELRNARTLLANSLLKNEYGVLGRAYEKHELPDRFDDAAVALLSLGRHKAQWDRRVIEAMADVAGRQVAAAFSLKVQANERRAVREAALKFALLLSPGGSSGTSALRELIELQVASNDLNNAFRTFAKFSRRSPEAESLRFASTDFPRHIAEIERRTGASSAIEMGQHLRAADPKILTVLALAVARDHLLQGRADLSLPATRLAAARVKLGTNEYARTVLYLTSAALLDGDVAAAIAAMASLPASALTAADRPLAGALDSLFAQLKARNLKPAGDRATKTQLDRPNGLALTRSRAQRAIEAADELTQALLQ